MGISKFFSGNIFFKNCKGHNFKGKSDRYDEAVRRAYFKHGGIEGKDTAAYIREQCPEVTVSEGRVFVNPCLLLESWESCDTEVSPVSLEVCKEIEVKDRVFGSPKLENLKWLKNCEVAACLAKDCGTLPPSVKNHTTTVETTQEPVVSTASQEPVVSTTNTSAVLSTVVAAVNITSSLCGAFLSNASNLIAGNESSNNQTADCLSQEINAYNHDNSLLYMSVIGGTAVFLTALGGIACAIKSYQDNQRRAAYQEVMKSTGV